MKSIAIYWYVLFCLITQQTWAQSGLKGEYYVGTNFEKKVFTRIDPAISFDWPKRNFSWLKRTPGPGMPESYYSIRWTGKLMAPISGVYIFNAKVDDGIRVWVGNKKVIDAWHLNDLRHFNGRVILEAGKFYDLRVDYFNDMLGGAIDLLWVLPNAPRLIFNGISTPGESITSKYFFQKAPPAPIPTKPPVPVTTTPVVAVAPPPKVIPKKPLPVVKPIPILTPLPPKRTAVVDTVVSSAPIRKQAPEPSSDLKPGATFILPNVQFEQSSYILLPESSIELNKLVQAMRANPQWYVHIAGHTDNVGDSRLNLALSENRAKVVANYLIRQGIADERITTEGFGGKRPIANNSIESERSKNRRVEITIR